MNATRPVPHARWARLWTTAARRLFLDRHLDFWLAEAGTTGSTREIRARVVAIHRETHDTRTFVLAPNARWPGHRAGQHLTLAVEIDGVRTRRCYTISSPPHAPHPTITVKRVPGGRVSGFLHDRVHVGDVVVIEGVGGDFVAPPQADHPLLFLAGGSGVTPILSMLDTLAARGPLRDIVVVNHVRSADDVIGHRRLTALTQAHPGLRLHLLRDDDPARAPGFHPDELTRLVPDLAHREAWMCGPPGLMAGVDALWASRALPLPLHRERFTLAAPPPSDGPVTLTLSDGRQVALSGRGTLLEQLEAAGLRPRHGCRIGICRTCTCRKPRGVVEDLRTGEVSDGADDLIQLCVTTPRSDLTLDLKETP